MECNAVKYGDILYIPTQLYIYSGWRDVAGGKATVRAVHVDEERPDNDCNKYTVSFFGFPRSLYNLKWILENREKWKEEYGERIAHPDPDYG